MTTHSQNFRCEEIFTSTIFAFQCHHSSWIDTRSTNASHKSSQSNCRIEAKGDTRARGNIARGFNENRVFSKFSTRCSIDVVGDAAYNVDFFLWTLSASRDYNVARTTYICDGSRVSKLVADTIMCTDEVCKVLYDVVQSFTRCKTKSNA